MEDTNTRIRVLIAEDEDADAELVQHALRRGGFEGEWRRVDNEADFCRALDDLPDIVIADYSMPQFDAPRALELLRDTDQDIPFIVVSGTIGDETAARIMVAGANDCVLKHNLVRLAPAVRRELAEAALRREHRRVQEEIREGKNVLEKVFASLSEAVMLLDPTERTIVQCNPSVESVFGYTAGDLIGRSTELLHVDREHFEDFGRRSVQALEARGVFEAEFEMRYRDGRVIDTEHTVTLLDETRGLPGGVVSVVRDISGRKATERELHRHAHVLGERVKELRCMSRIAELCARPRLSVPDLLSAAVRVLPSAWQYPDIAQARIRLDEFSHHTPGLRESAWLQRADISPAGRRRGAVEVFYAESRPHADEGPFLKEERALIDAVARQIAETVAAREARGQLLASEQRFRTLAVSTSQIVWTADRDGGMLEPSQSWLAYTGQTAAETLSNPWAAVHPDDLDQATTAWESALRNRVTFEVEFRIRRSDGVYRHFTVRGVPVLDAGVVREWIGTCTDITDRRNAEDALRRSERRHRTLLEQAADGIFTADASGRFISVNRRACEIAGYSEAELRTMGFRDLILPEDVENRPLQFDELNTGRTVTTERRLRRKDGQVVVVELNSRMLEDGLIQGIARDITRRREEELEMRKLSNAVTQTADLIIITDARGVIEYVNPAFERVTGYPRADVVGRRPSILRSGRHDSDYFRDMWSVIGRGESFHDVLINRKRDGDLYYEDKTITPLQDSDGRITHYISTGRDVTEQLQARDRLLHLATHDPLTDLPNRTALAERIETAIARAAWTHRHPSVLFINLDRFKRINETLGREAGDRVLCAVAQRLGGQLRGGDVIARVSGDEFAVLLEDVHDPEDTPRVAEKLVAALQEPIVVGDHAPVVGASIGIAVYPADGTDAHTLLRNADTSMNMVKESGQGSVGFFSPEMGERAQERFTMENDLRRALQREEFVLHFQPQIDLRTGRITAAEALLRWQHPRRGLVPPAAFIPLLEESGLMRPVGHWVLQEACRRLAAWHQTLATPPRVSVNLSATQLADPELASSFEAVLSQFGIEPLLLELEITETAIMRNVDLAAGVLRSLRETGIRIAVDDFGTGYSSMAYLKHFSVDTLKIDQTFTADICRDRNSFAIVRASIALARSLQLHVVAEGIETAPQIDALRLLGCNTAQGFYFSKPLPAGVFAELLGGSSTLDVPQPNTLMAGRRLVALSRDGPLNDVLRRLCAAGRSEITIVDGADEAMNAIDEPGAQVVVLDASAAGAQTSTLARRILAGGRAGTLIVVCEHVEEAAFADEGIAHVLVRPLDLDFVQVAVMSACTAAVEAARGR
jgi:diguanylate cyclase (GGDEF)-like protein/PAS domain S-box-containing protein